MLLPIFLVMTHSSTLYEKEVGAGLVVDSVKKKNCVTHFAPQGLTYQTLNRKKQTNKQTKQNISYRGRVLLETLLNLDGYGVYRSHYAGPIFDLTGEKFCFDFVVKFLDG